MPNSYFQFKQFIVHHDRCAMKVTTDSCLFGAWVAELIKIVKPTPAHLLDIGTGTGLLSLMVAQKNDVMIEAVEIDVSAADQAKENVAASLWKNKITVLHQNVLQWQTTTKYDCIFSNPPFYENEIKAAKSTKNIAHHDEGLKLAELFTFLKNRVSKNGFFFLLLPAKREKEAENLLARSGLFIEQKVFVQQTLKHPPFRVMIQGRRQKVDTVSVKFISIRNNANEYTPDFMELLKDYYLYL